MGRFSDLDCTRTVCAGVLACATRCFLAVKKDPLEVKIRPKLTLNVLSAFQVSRVQQTGPKMYMPPFTDYVTARLLANDSHLVWHTMVEEAAYFYLGNYPTIGKDNSSGEYKILGQKILHSFPCIKRPGIQPWVLVCTASLLKTLKVKEKLTVTSIFFPQLFLHD